MHEQCLSPDIYTFSALAKGCQDRHAAEQLLNEMKVNLFQYHLSCFLMKYFCN
jgi:hypothetical protein